MLDRPGEPNIITRANAILKRGGQSKRCYSPDFEGGIRDHKPKNAGDF